MVHEINSIYKVPKLKQNFQKGEVVTGKTLLFVIGQFFFSPVIYLFTYTLFYVDIYNKKHKTVIYTTHYIKIAIQMVFNKQIHMLVYVNQTNWEK